MFVQNQQKVLEMFATLAGLSLEQALNWEFLCRLSFDHTVARLKPDILLDDFIEKIIAATAADAYYNYSLFLETQSSPSFKVGDFSMSARSANSSSTAFARLFKDEMFARCSDCLLLEDNLVFRTA